MDYVVAGANLRAFMFGIKGKLVMRTKTCLAHENSFLGGLYNRCKL